MPPRKFPPDPPAKAQPQEPPWYEAAVPIPCPGASHHGPFAFQPGDRVPAELVNAHGWGGHVKVPQAFEGLLEQPPAPEPEPPATAAEE